MTKQELQQGIVLPAKNRKLIILEWATGSGKSFGAIRLIEELKPEKILLLVAESSHKDNWRKEFAKYESINNTEILGKLNSIVIECYASLKKYDNTEWDLIILDEAHHVTSELRNESLHSMKTKHTIVLSATIEESDLLVIKSALNLGYSDIYHSKIPLRQAIEWGLLPEPDIYLIPVELNSFKKDQIIEESWGVESRQKEFRIDYSDYWTYKKKDKYPNTKLIISCTELEKCRYLDRQIEYYKGLFMRTYQDHIKNKWLRLGTERKRYLGSLKTKHVLKLLSSIKSKRYICFCSSIEQSNELNSGAAIHSKNTESVNNKLLQSFQSGQINHLFCVGKLTEGQNLVNIEAGIIVQLDGKERPFTQKHGRILRSENPVQFIFYYKNTRDEEYLNNILEGINTDYVQIIENLNNFILWYWILYFL